MPVNQEERRTKRMVTAIMVCVGPIWRLPERLRSHRNPGRIKKTKKRIHPMQTNKTYSAVRPEPLLTSATQRARRIHPTTSLPTPAARTVTPTGVDNSFSSVRIRHKTGKAVI